MSDISLVDINELTATSSQDKDTLFVVEVPSGGGFAQFKITKEDIFAIASTMKLQFSGETAEFINFDSADDISLNYIASANYLYYNNLKRLFFSGDGSTADIQIANETIASIQIGSANKEGALVLIDTEGNSATITADLTDELDDDIEVVIGDPLHEFDPENDTVTMAFREDYQFLSESNPSSGANIQAPSGREVVVFVDIISSIATLTLTFPEAPRPGDRCTFKQQSGGTTAITMATLSTETIEGAITGAGTSEVKTWVYDIILDKWIVIA